MTIATPYLLYLGRSVDPADVKTSRGIAAFRPDLCVGEFRQDACPLSLGLPRMSFDQAVAAGARTLVLGIANAGGTLNDALVEDGVAALEAGLDLAAGLHHRLCDEPRLRETARRLGRALHDVRVPPANIPVGTGNVRAGNRLLTVGTDCSVGKMYTSLCLVSAFKARNIAADFRATGQTGILVGGSGVPLDAVVADFISGAIEQLAPARADDGWDVIEGQGSLFHPSFAGVSLGLLHGAQPSALVMCHDPSREHLRGIPGRGLPAIADCLAANLEAARLTSPTIRAVGVALNTSAMNEDMAQRACETIGVSVGLPCTDPYRMGVEPILDYLLTGDRTPVDAAA
ncbi:N-acetyltransferase DgcN [Qipengyuania sp.]|uniref:N-acetyltransferase DgcN n=1 Tax=Qipengyuania sp. TaxID=2004515 RepID=UPI0035C7A721